MDISYKTSKFNIIRIYVASQFYWDSAQQSFAWVWMEVCTDPTHSIH